MLILAIDTSTRYGSVALAQDGHLIREKKRVCSSPSHARTLLAAIDEILADGSLEVGALGAVAVTCGPGSFTGLRIGVGTTKALAYSLSIPAVAVPTLDAMAACLSSCDTDLCPLLDARKSEVYCGLYRSRNGAVERLTEAMVLPPAELPRYISRPTLFFGEGARVYRTLLLEGLGDKARFRGEDGLVSVAAAAARIGWHALATDRGPRKLELLYVRASEAELRRRSKGEKEEEDLMRMSDSELISRIRREDPEFDELWKEHEYLEGQLHELNSLQYLTASQEMRKKEIQKLKLRGKDRMALIMERYRFNEPQQHVESSR